MVTRDAARRQVFEAAVSSSVKWRVNLNRNLFVAAALFFGALARDVFNFVPIILITSFLWVNMKLV